MNGLTEAAIRTAFEELLEEKPCSKITVRDIVERCGINRNSFYYHFADIPNLLDRILQEEIDSYIAAYPTISSLEDCLRVVIRAVQPRRRSLMHIYHSVGREAYERHLWMLCERAVRTYFETVLPAAAISEADREVLLRYLKCECFGTVTDWLETGMTYDLEAYVHRLLELRSDTLTETLRRLCGAEAPQSRRNED